MGAAPQQQQISANERVAEFRKTFARAEAEVGRVIVGHKEVIRKVLTALFAGGHVLIEGVPGLGKTLMVKTAAEALGLSFKRIQFTPDLMPSDIVGTQILTETDGRREFNFKAGPIFAHVVLGDEINRATPKTQSALLEAMNEQQVTIDGRSSHLARPFMVIATQNPVEHHGTYPLPESQLDRFLMRIRIGYPDAEAAREILRNNDSHAAEAVRPVISGEDLLQLQSWVTQVGVDPVVVDYMLAIVERTRSHESLALGVSPRGAQALYRAAQAIALVEGRDYVIPDDVKRLVIPVFAHRVIMNSRVALTQRTSEWSERVLQEILTLVDVPL
jgi:MoxR-like ATPase